MRLHFNGHGGPQGLQALPQTAVHLQQQRPDSIPGFGAVAPNSQGAGNVAPAAHVGRDAILGPALGALHSGPSWTAQGAHHLGAHVSGTGLDMATLLLMQSLDGQRGPQPNNNDMLMQMLMQQRQQQGQQGTQARQQQMLQAMMGAQQQQVPQLLEPAQAGSSGGPLSGGWPAAAAAAAGPTVTGQQQQQQLGAPVSTGFAPAGAAPAGNSAATATTAATEVAAELYGCGSLGSVARQPWSDALGSNLCGSIAPPHRGLTIQHVLAQQLQHLLPGLQNEPQACRSALLQHQLTDRTGPCGVPAPAGTGSAAAAAAAAAAGGGGGGSFVQQGLMQLPDAVWSALLEAAAAPGQQVRPDIFTGFMPAAGAPTAAAMMAAPQASTGVAAAACLDIDSTVINGLISQLMEFLEQNGGVQQSQAQPGAADLPPAVAPEPQEPLLPRQAPEEGLWQHVLQQLFFYLEQDVQAMQAAAGMPVAHKKARTTPTEGPLPPLRSLLSEDDRNALDQVLGLLKKRQDQQQEGFWQLAWHRVQRYLRLTDETAQQQEEDEKAAAAGDGAAAAAAAAAAGSKRSLRDVSSVEPVAMQELPVKEQAALQKILEPIRKDQIATLQQRLEGLASYPLEAGQVAGMQAGAEGMAAADPAAAAAAAAAASAMMMQQMYGFESGYPGWPLLPVSEGDEAGGFDMQGQWGLGRVGTVRGRGGRPKGSGNRVQMAPRPPPTDASEASQAKFSLRSVKYTGVYRSRRSQEGWRAQFCYANKVINLGTFATEEEAAHMWNEAALLFRGRDAVLNPVEPPLPADYEPGELHLASDKAASAVVAAAVAAGLQPPKVVVRPV